MPVYNGEDFLHETIESVLNQTYSDFLFLIINDGSKDKTKEIIKNYADKRIIYHENETNLGLVASLNKGINMVETEFMARIDADDLWVQNKLEKQINLLDSHPDIGICGTSIKKFGAFEGTFIFPTENETLKAGFLFYCMMSHPSVIFRMSFLKETGLRYRPDFYPAEDYKMWVDALLHTQIYNIPEVLVYYRQHDNQITQETNILQKTKTNEIKVELLRRIYPNVTEEELSFHLNSFIPLDFKSISDYKKSKNWTNKIITKNNETQYIKPEILKKELSRYLQIGLKGYLLKKYFEKISIINYFKYICSFDWIHLSAKKNFKLFFKTILK